MARTGRPGPIDDIDLAFDRLRAEQRRRRRGRRQLAWLLVLLGFGGLAIVLLSPSRVAPPPTATPPTATAPRVVYVGTPPAPVPPSPTAASAALAKAPTPSQGPGLLTSLFGGDALTVDLTGGFSASVVRVGYPVTATLVASNKSNRPIPGMTFYTRGPWDKFTLLEVWPRLGGRFGDFAPGRSSGFIPVFQDVPPGGTLSMTIVAAANDPGNHRFWFTVQDRDIHDFRDGLGRDTPSVFLNLAVVR